MMKRSYARTLSGAGLVVALAIPAARLDAADTDFVSAPVPVTVTQ
jgi:hypothetical protein